MTDRKQTPDVLGQILGGETLEDAAEGIAQRPAVSEAGWVQPSEAGRVQPSETERKRSRPRSSRAAKKQKWEVLLVSFQEHRGWRPRYINGQEVGDWMEGPVIHDYVAGLGDEGWELIGASAGERMYGLTDLRQLYFKRPKD